MNPIQRAVHAAISGEKPAPFQIGKHHKSPAKLAWERRERLRENKKKLKRLRRQIARAETKAGRRDAKQKKRRLANALDRCRLLSGETAEDAKLRSIAESGLDQKGWYHEVYLASGHWRTLRTAALVASDGLCSDCRKPFTSLDVHHLNYRDIFDVQPADLVCLCRGCHDERHARS